MCVAKHWWYALGTQFCVFKLIFLLHWVIQLLVFHYSSNWTRKRTNSGLSTGQNCTPFLEFDSFETRSGSEYQLPPPCPVNKIRWYSMFRLNQDCIIFWSSQKGHDTLHKPFATKRETQNLEHEQICKPFDIQYRTPHKYF